MRSFQKLHEILDSLKDTRGGIGAYKMHDLRDPIVFHNGFKLQFRSGESTSGCGSELLCPNQWCQPDKKPAGTFETDKIMEATVLKRKNARASQQNFSVGIHKAVVDAGCVPGPVAFGFDRNGGDLRYFGMKTENGQLCSGGAMINATGCPCLG